MALKQKTRLQNISHTPDPHPLDYDWRFTDDTVKNLANSVRGNAVLLLGCPSLAEPLAKCEKLVTVVDRQPLFFTHAQIKSLCLDLRFTAISRFDLGRFDCIIFDSPWYIDYVFDWLQEACEHINPDGVIMFSLWPAETRLHASDEIGFILKKVADIGSFSFEKEFLTYATPVFEQKTAEAVHNVTQPNWRKGDLVCLKATNTYAITKKIFKYPRNVAKPMWHRFVFDNLQIAIKNHDNDQNAYPKVEEMFDDNITPSISRRFSRRNEIDIWTSDNQAFKASGTRHFVDALENVLKRNHCKSSSLTLEAKNLMFRHKIIRSELFGRGYQWQHRD